MKKILDDNFSIDKLKQFTNSELVFLSNEIRNVILEIAQNKEIHFSSNLGIVELTISLFIHFDFLKDKIFYDTGHQTYVHKILTNRKDQLFKLKEENGPIGLMDMNDSEYDHYSPGHSGNVLSVMSGLCLNNDSYNVVVVGDAAINNGLSFEGLSDIGANQSKVIVIINDNQMSISKSNGALVNHLDAIKDDAKKSMNFFTSLGFHYIGPVDGHDFTSLSNGLIEAKNKVMNGPIVVHVKTTKGKGIPQVDCDADGSYHGNSLSKKTTFGNIAFSNLKEKLKLDNKIKILNPAMNIGSGFNEMFLEKNPNYFDTGICESHTVSKATGLVLGGNKVFLLFYSTFLQRSYDQLLHDAARLNLNLTILLDRSDLASNEGNSHHGIFDVTYLKSMPNTNLCSPRDFNQLNQLIDYYCNNNQGINIIRYPTAPFMNLELNDNYLINKNQFETLIDNDNEIAILTYGPYTNVIYQNIVDQDVKVDLYNTIWINDLNKDTVKQILTKYKTVIVYERIYSSNGMFSEINELKNKYNLNTKLIPMNYKNFMGHGPIHVLDKKEKMNFDSIKENIYNEQ